MAAFNTVLDAAALTDNVQTIDRSGPSDRDQITADIVQVLKDAQWTVTSGPTTQAHGNGWELYGQQSPWYDLDNTPVWYTGNIPAIRIDNTNALAIRIQAGVRNGIGNVLFGGNGGENGRFDLATSAIDMYYHANPFQFAMWPLVRPANSHNNNPFFFISALHVPKHVLQREKVKSTIIASDDIDGQFNSYHASGYIIYQDNFGNNVANTATFTHFTLFGSHRLVHSATRFMWNPSADPEMANAGDNSSAVPFGLYQPMFQTASIATRLDSSHKFALFGFLWDTIQINDAFLKGSATETLSRAKSQVFFNFSGQRWINLGMMLRQTDTDVASINSRLMTYFLRVNEEEDV